MKKGYCFLCGMVLLVSCYQPERNCEDYKTGKFKFNYVAEGEEREGTFTRDMTYSVEYYDQKIDSATVKWINDCEFILQDVKTKASVHMKILSTTENSYTFEYGYVGDTKKVQGTAIRTN